jgi:hypothetical protein
MARMIPLSIVLVTIVVPILLARRPTRRSFRSLVLWMAVFSLLWAILCVSVYPKYVFPE